MESIDLTEKKLLLSTSLQFQQRYNQIELYVSVKVIVTVRVAASSDHTEGEAQSKPIAEQHHGTSSSGTAAPCGIFLHFSQTSQDTQLSVIRLGSTVLVFLSSVTPTRSLFVEITAFIYKR